MAAASMKKFSSLAITKCKCVVNSCWSKCPTLTHRSVSSSTFSYHSSKFICRRHFTYDNNDVALDWEDADDIADLLLEEYQHVDPLTLRFEELENMVMDTVVKKNKKKLSGRCNEGVLENIQMNWLEKYNEENS
ncbi:FeS assembly protein IscX [Plasmodium fragile]|uniref:FeS assembly protein IscX n=1 Tax=Plasmodium fragile TaxID=5857 RepID=A0A0D9QNL6_PLAFR|nr:FeS assembly protein IscX [Plasmodium fragile]KJP87301.1 FeS assembly protein IscX [Plasmodium fragile]